jgi:hypothetical protein
VQVLMNDYDVQEGFIYDYKKKLWYKFDRSKGAILGEPSFCDALQVDLNNFLSK